MPALRVDLLKFLTSDRGQPDSPLAHTDVSLAVLNAANMSIRKPLGERTGRKVMDLAAARGCVGYAPDTFLGGGHQTARVIDSGPSTSRSPAPSSCVPDTGLIRRRLLSAGRRADADMGPTITNLSELLGPIASQRLPPGSARGHEPLNGTRSSRSGRDTLPGLLGSLRSAPSFRSS